LSGERRGYPFPFPFLLGIFTLPKGKREEGKKGEKGEPPELTTLCVQDAAGKEKAKRCTCFPQVPGYHFPGKEKRRKKRKREGGRTGGRPLLYTWGPRGDAREKEKIGRPVSRCVLCTPICSREKWEKRGIIIITASPRRI